MVDPSDSVKGSHHKHPNDDHPKAKDITKPAVSHQPYHVSDKALAPFKKMLPGATEEQLQQIFNNFMKCIADQIQRDQSFHEEQRQQRKEDSGDDGEF
jgi:hypothetical protein